MKIVLSILIWCISSCSVKPSFPANSNCVENKKFKKFYLSQIDYVKKNISVSQDKEFLEALIFISNYAPVSFDEMMNYSRTYGLKTLEKDEVIWLKWYQENKCRNLQLEKNIKFQKSI